jgi:hypothetical protein
VVQIHQQRGQAEARGGQGLAFGHPSDVFGGDRMNGEEGGREER